LLKFESDLVCPPCRLGKMIVASHFPVNTVMAEHSGQLLHTDTVGPSRVRSMGGKWYVLVVVNDYSRYSWVFFLESKDAVFEHFRSLTLRDYRASTVMKMNHYFYLHHHLSLFLLSQLKQRLLKLPPTPQQQWRCHGLRGRSFSSRELLLTFRRHIHLSIS
jgi:hypothetical protein